MIAIIKQANDSLVDTDVRFHAGDNHLAATDLFKLRQKFRFSATAEADFFDDGIFAGLRQLRNGMTDSFWILFRCHHRDTEQLVVYEQRPGAGPAGWA